MDENKEYKPLLASKFQMLLSALHSNQYLFIRKMI